MKSPRTRGEVTKEWVEYMLTEFENRNKPGSQVTIKTWYSGDASKKGDGFSGDLLKLEVKATVQNSGVSSDKEYHHIVKFTPQDPIQREVIKKLGNTTREFLCYSEVIEELNKFQANLTNNMFPISMPTYVFGRHNDKEHVFVMENMKHLGFENKPKSEFLNFEEAKIALEQLARLHAISYVYDKTHTITEKYPIFNAKMLMTLLSSGQILIIDMAVEFLKFHGEYQNLIDKILASKTQMLDKSKKCFTTRDQPQIFCLNHGDPWNNNILVRQSADDSKSNLSVCFIDFEAVNWNTSAYDLNYFLAGGVTPEVRLKHLDELLHHYHDHFTEVTNKLGSPIPNWSYQNLKNEYDALSVWGILKALGMSMILSEASKDFQMANHNQTTNPMIKSIKKGFGKVMASILMKPSMTKKFAIQMMKGFIDPVLKEIKSGTNPDLNERFLANILEGDKRGLFDLHVK